MEETLVYLTWKYKGNIKDIYYALRNKEETNKAELTQFLLELEKQNIEYITVLDDNYPSDLKIVKYSPYVLFYKGNLELLKNNKICLTADYDNEICKNNIQNNIEILVKNNTLVTTNFKNLDAYIIQKWREKEGNIIFPLANGIGFNNEEIINEKELLISMYPPNVNPKLERYRERNVLISLLCKYLICYSAKNNSGIINLALSFANVGKEVYCYPGYSLDDGNTFLIKSGANMITGLADIYYY
ncbi:DNA-processing protein DprA [Mycoplasmopsis meleagridis]|uniref:DNA-processing protein DprA n=1 Tax=Mycoplasmopsis meleagridis TaxID=29561 RepID=UPI00073D9758|nr:DNA-processing protein DprA [Mycoplasmopsis meleagridis]KUH47428.1 DNA processing protein DprA [Mycoplasmopsis meleagridis]